MQAVWESSTVGLSELSPGLGGVDGTDRLACMQPSLCLPPVLRLRRCSSDRGARPTHSSVWLRPPATLCTLLTPSTLCCMLQEVPRWPRQALQDLLTDALRCGWLGWVRGVSQFWANGLQSSRLKALISKQRSCQAPSKPSKLTDRTRLHRPPALQQALEPPPAQRAGSDQWGGDSDGSSGPGEQPGAATHLRGF